MLTLFLFTCLLLSNKSISVRFCKQLNIHKFHPPPFFKSPNQENIIFFKSTPKFCDRNNEKPDVFSGNTRFMEICSIMCLKMKKGSQTDYLLTYFYKNGLYIESEMHDIAILHYIFLPFNSHFASFLTSLF